VKVFYHILANAIIGNVTNMTVWFGLTFFAYLETQSVLVTGVISGIFLIATAASGIWFGSIVDHHKKKNVMLVSSVISLIIYVFGFVIYLLADPGDFKYQGSIVLWVFITILLIGVTVGNLRNIALPTLVTIMIPEDRRDKANGLVGTATGVAFLIVSMISGVLVGLGGMQYVLILALAMTLLTIVHLWFIQIPETKILHTGEGEQQNETAQAGDVMQKNSIDIRGTMKVVAAVPGLLALIIFATINNFLGGVFMALMDAYGLSLVKVEIWGFLWGGLSTGFIIGGFLIAKWGLGKNPLRTLFLANIVIWIVSSIFTLRSSIVLLAVGMLVYITIVPFIEAAEQTIIQKVIPQNRQGRVFGFAQSIEQAASPLTSFAIGPIAQFIFIPFMTTGAGVDLIGDWFGTGADRGIALVFTLTGVIGLTVTILAMKSRYYKLLSERYLKG